MSIRYLTAVLCGLLGGCAGGLSAQEGGDGGLVPGVVTSAGGACVIPQAAVDAVDVEGCRAGVLTIGPGTYSGTTCGCADLVRHNCNAQGLPERRFRIVLPAEVEGGCMIHFHAGFLSSYQIGSQICTQHNPGDGAAIGISGGATASETLLSVEFLRAGCGEYKFAVSCGSGAPATGGAAVGAATDACSSANARGGAGTGGNPGDGGSRDSGAAVTPGGASDAAPASDLPHPL